MPKVRPGPRKKKPHAEGGTIPGEWRGRMRLWIDIGGHNALGPGKVRLLEAIGTTRSLVTAASQLRMSYRQAWKHLRLIEERTGLAVVEPKRGGRGGGGTDLTPDGKALVAAFHEFRREVEEHMQSTCTRRFAKWSLKSPAHPKSQT